MKGGGTESVGGRPPATFLSIPQGSVAGITDAGPGGAPQGEPRPARPTRDGMRGESGSPVRAALRDSGAVRAPLPSLCADECVRVNPAESAGTRQNRRLPPFRPDVWPVCALPKGNGPSILSKVSVPAGFTGDGGARGSRCRGLFNRYRLPIPVRMCWTRPSAFGATAAGAEH